MVDIARLYHPAYSNDPRILAWCAALPEVSDCSSASVTPARAQWCCRSRVKAQIDPRVLLADAAGRDHCPARRVGQSALLRRLLDLPTVGIPHRPLLAGGSSPADSRGPSACCRSVTGSSRTGCGPRASAHPHVVHPGWRVNLPTAVELVLAATAHRRTPEHAARCPPQRPDCSPRGIRARPHGVTSAVTIDILLRPTATEPDRHERPGAQRVRRPQPHQDHTAQHQPAQPRHRGAAVATATIEITAGQLDPAAVGGLLICSNTKCSHTPHGVTPHARLANPTDSPRRLSDASCDTSVTITRAAGNNEMCSPARGKPGSRPVSVVEGMRGHDNPTCVSQLAENSARPSGRQI